MHEQVENLDKKIVTCFNVHELISKHKDTLHKIINSLDNVNLLNEDNIRLVAKHSQICTLRPIFEILEKTKILDQTNFNLLLGLTDIYYLFTILILLRDDGILNKETFSAVMKHQAPSKLSLAILEIHQTAKLTEEKFDLIIQQPENNKQKFKIALGGFFAGGAVTGLTLAITPAAVDFVYASMDRHFNLSGHWCICNLLACFVNSKT